MVRICKIGQWQQCSISWQQAGHVEIYVVLIKTTSQVRTLQVSALMIQYLVLVSFELWMV